MNNIIIIITITNSLSQLRISSMNMKTQLNAFIVKWMTKKLNQKQSDKFLRWTPFFHST